MNRWETIFGEAPPSFEDRVRDTLGGLEEKTVKKRTKKTTKRTILIIAAAAALLLALGAAAYAADVWGIHRNVQFWLRGEPTDAVVDVNADGSYNVSYTDSDGIMTVRGGVPVYPDGSPRYLTPEEVLENLNAPEVEDRDDGSVWVYYYDRKIEITEDLAADGVCYVRLEHGDEVLYLTVKYDRNGYVSWWTGTDGYPAPDSF